MQIKNPVKTGFRYRVVLVLDHHGLSLNATSMSHHLGDAMMTEIGEYPDRIVKIFLNIRCEVTT